MVENNNQETFTKNNQLNGPQSFFLSYSKLFFPGHPSMLAHAAADAQQAQQPKERKKPCCVCKMTKKLRDACVRNVDDGEVECIDFIEAHKTCLRSRGFRA